MNANELANKLYVSICPFKDFKHIKKKNTDNPLDIDTKVKNLIINGQVAMAEFVAFAEYMKNFGRLPKYNDKEASPKRPQNMRNLAKL